MPAAKVIKYVERLRMKRQMKIQGLASEKEK